MKNRRTRFPLCRIWNRLSSILRLCFVRCQWECRHHKRRVPAASESRAGKRLSVQIRSRRRSLDAPRRQSRFRCRHFAGEYNGQDPQFAVYCFRSIIDGRIERFADASRERGICARLCRPAKHLCTSRGHGAPILALALVGKLDRPQPLNSPAYPLDTRAMNSIQ